MTRPRRTRTEDGRRLASAGHAVLVTWIGLVVASLLNAPGMHKTAFNQDDGLTRDVALALTGPLAGVSGALQLDRPRALVKATLGRSDDDEIDTKIALPAPGGSTTPAPPPTRKLVFTPKRKLRLWVGGDSLVIIPGFSIVEAAAASPVLEPVGKVDGRIATGLERPDVFDWFEHVRVQVRKLQPKAVVLGLGANDDHGYMTGLPEGVSLDGFGGPVWTNGVPPPRRRVDGHRDQGGRARRLDRPADHERPGPVGALRHDQRDRGAGGAQASWARLLRGHVHALRGRRRRLRGVPAERRRAASSRYAGATASTSSGPAARSSRARFCGA